MRYTYSPMTHPSDIVAETLGSTLRHNVLGCVYCGVLVSMRHIAQSFQQAETSFGKGAV